MYLSNRLYVITGIVLIAIPICLVLGIVLSGAASNNDATSKADVAKYLKDIYDHRTVFLISKLFFVLLDSVFTMLVAPLTFLVFRDRSRLLAYFFLTGFIGSFILSSVSDGLDASTLLLAKDFAHGGAGLNAGDPAIQELTHYITVAQAIVGQFGGTMLGIAFLTLGWLIARAPTGNVNPPRAIGWVIIVDGIAQLFGWTRFLGGVAFIDFIAFGITTLIFTIWLGVWLIMNSSKLPLPDGAAA
jgi:hypothetical protein